LQEVGKGVGVASVIVLEAGFNDVGCCVFSTVVMMLSKIRSLYKAPRVLNRVQVYKTLSVGYG